jgi:hypothetical protein
MALLDDGVLAASRLEDIEELLRLGGADLALGERVGA